MKKMMSLVLAMVMVLSLSVCAFAESTLMDAALVSLMNGEHIAVLGEDAYSMYAGQVVEVAGAGNVELKAGQKAPAMAIVSTDGATWAVAEVKDNGDGTVAVDAPAGVVALMYAYDATATQTAVVGGEQATGETLATGSAGEYEGSAFTPSVAAEAAPELVPAPGSSSTVTIGTPATTGTTTTVTTTDVVTSLVKVTSVAERENVNDALTAARLNIAFNQMLATAVADLPVAAEIDAALAGTGLTAANAVVRDLFDVALYGDAAEKLAVEGSTLTMTFGLDVTEPLVMMVSVDGVNWQVLPAQNVKVNANGTVTVTTGVVGVFATVVAQ